MMTNDEQLNLLTDRIYRKQTKKRKRNFVSALSCFFFFLLTGFLLLLVNIWLLQYVVVFSISSKYFP